MEVTVALSITLSVSIRTGLADGVPMVDGPNTREELVMQRRQTLALALTAAFVATAVVIVALLGGPDGSREQGSKARVDARGHGQNFGTNRGSGDRAAAPGPGRTFGPNRARRRRQQRNRNEIAKALASELRVPERRVKRALIAVQRRRFEARLKERLKMIRRSERRAQRIRERAR